MIGAVRAQKAVDARYELPEEFVQAYMPELRRWGLSFAQKGPHCQVIFRPILAAPVELDANGQAPMRGAWLQATVERARRGSGEVRLVIAPAEENDRRLIERHAEEIRRYGPPLAMHLVPKPAVQ